MTCPSEEFLELHDIAAELGIEPDENESADALIVRLLEELDDRFETIETLFERLMHLDIAADCEEEA